MAWVYGIHAVEELLGDDASQVQEIWFVRSRKPGPARERVRELAEQLGVRFRMVTDPQLEKAVGEVKHQGVAARVSEYAYADVRSILGVEGDAVVLVLDEVQDPHNLGAILRTAAGLGAAGVVIPRHRSASVTSAVRKVAVGAERRVPVAQVTNLSRFLEEARDSGFWVYGLEATGEGVLGEVPLSERAVLVLGSEGRGIRPNVASKCDVLLRIPLGELESLNVSVAAGIAMWEWGRLKNG